MHNQGEVGRHYILEPTMVMLTPKDLNLLKNQMEVESKLEISKFELTDVVEVKTTTDEGMPFVILGAHTMREQINWLGAKARYTPWF
jgi:hypothetical protein